MNQALLFNDDLHFDEQHDAWALTGQLSGQRVTIFFHSVQLKNIAKICTWNP